MSSRDRGLKLVDALLRSRSDEAVKILKDKGDVDLTIENKGDYAMHLAARRGDVNVITAMKVKGADLGQKNMAHNVPMHYAAKGGYLDLVRYLKANGAKLNSANLDGESPLHEAVKTQTMDIIETLVDLGMDTNVRNKEGETVLHTALKYGAVEAMEALLIKKANPDAKDNAGRKPKDVAKNASIREHLQIHSAMMFAMQTGNIKAKGMKINRKDVSKPTKIDRVGIIIETIDIPKEFPTGFYCRREKSENTTIALPAHEEETIFSDVFHIRIFEVNRDCKTKISLPVYKAPSDKQQMVVRIVTPENEVKIIDSYETTNKVNYCLLETKLIPETTCTCVIYVRPKKEENKVTEEGAMITSEIEKDFSLEVPAGSFEGETVLSLTVFETNADDYVELDDDLEDDIKSESGNAKVKSPNKRSSNTETNRRDSVVDEVQASVDTDGNDKERITDTLKQPDDLTESKKKSNLLTDVYQINIEGQQPKKGIKVQIPLCEGMNPDDEIAIVHADENDLDNDDALEIVPVKPQVIGMNLVFEVTQFCIYVASWKKKVGTKEEKIELQRQISMTRDKRKPASLFAVIKQVEGLRHIMVVECVVSNKSNERRRRWLEKEAYEIQNPPEASEIMMTPGDTFYVNVEGNAHLEEQSDSTERKLQFYQVRSSWQPYYIHLEENIYEAEKAVGYVVVSKKTDTGLEETARLRIKLTAPPRPPTPPPPESTSQQSAAMNRFKERQKPSEEELDSVDEMEAPSVLHRPLSSMSRQHRPSSSMSRLHRPSSSMSRLHRPSSSMSRQHRPSSSMSRLHSSTLSYRPKTAPSRQDRQSKQDKLAVVVERLNEKLKPSYKPDSSVQARFKRNSSKVGPVDLPGDVYRRGSHPGSLSDRSTSRQGSLSDRSTSRQSNKSSSNASTKSNESKERTRNLNVQPAKKSWNNNV